MNSKTVLIVAAVAGLWWWHKKRGVADDSSDLPFSEDTFCLGLNGFGDGRID
jgi:hypothetical protein